MNDLTVIKGSNIRLRKPDQNKKILIEIYSIKIYSYKMEEPTKHFLKSITLFLKPTKPFLNPQNTFLKQP